MPGGPPPRLRFFLLLIVCLLASLASSGCLRDEIFPEPFGWGRGEVLEGRGDANGRFEVPERATRFRISYEAALGVLPLLGNPQGTRLTLRDPDDRVYTYNRTATGTTQDLFGGPVGGTWSYTHSDPQGGSRFRIIIDHYQPKHEDWQWWQVWRS